MFVKIKVSLELTSMLFDFDHRTSVSDITNFPRCAHAKEEIKLGQGVRKDRKDKVIVKTVTEDL